MDKEKLNSFLDCIYELEGLVHLALSRDDEPSALAGLIARKGRELALQAQGFELGSEHSENSEHSETSEFSEHSENSEHSDISETSECSEHSDISETSECSEHSEISEQSDLSEPESAPQPAQMRGRLVFSVNDRYRFKRELFANSDVDFNTTLSLVASMESFDEAEDYFLNELAWDASRPEVADFLETLRRYFTR